MADIREQELVEGVRRALSDAYTRSDAIGRPQHTFRSVDADTSVPIDADGWRFWLTTHHGERILVRVEVQ